MTTVHDNFLADLLAGALAQLRHRTPKQSGKDAQWRTAAFLQNRQDALNFIHSNFAYDACIILGVNYNAYRRKADQLA